MLHVSGRKIKCPPRKGPTPNPEVVVIVAPTAVAPVVTATPAAVVDVSVLELSVKKVQQEVETGSHDSDLDALLKAEASGKARKGVLEMLKARREALV